MQKNWTPLPRRTRAGSVPTLGPSVPTRYSTPSMKLSKATLWVKAQHEGALPRPCIVRKDPRVPHTARRGA